MTVEASDIDTVTNDTTDQTITTAQPVTVTPVTAQPVTTQTSGAATIEEAVVADLQRNPSALLLAGGVVLVFGLVVFGWALYEWVATGNVRAGAIVTGVASPLGVAAAYLLGWVTTPPRGLVR